MRGDSKNVATAMAVYEVWPEVARKIKSDFLNQIWCRLPSDMDGNWDYGKKPRETYIYIYRKCWRPYVVDGQEEQTSIYMQAEDGNGTNWDIGVRSPASSSVSRDDRERSENLHVEIGSLAKRLGKNSNSKWPWWPWWEWIEGKYRYWDSLIPKLHEEVAEGGGEITDYFVRKFNEIADESIRIIDRIDGS